MDRLYGEVGGRWVSAAFKKLSYIMQKKLKHEQMYHVFVTENLSAVIWIWCIRKMCSGEQIRGLVLVLGCCVPGLALEKAEAASLQSLNFQLWKLLPDHETCLHCWILKPVLIFCSLPNNEGDFSLTVLWRSACRSAAQPSWLFSNLQDSCPSLRSLQRSNDFLDFLL